MQRQTENRSFKLSISVLVFIGLSFGLLILAAMPAQVHGEEVYDMNSATVKSIANQLSMEGHAKDDISTCATKIRYYEEIIELLNEGNSEDEVIDYYLGMYGEQALIEPSKSGFSLLAWTIPFIAIALVGIVLYVKLGRQIKSNVDEDGVQLDPTDEALSSYIDEERKKYY